MSLLSVSKMFNRVLRRNGMASGSERVFNIQYDSAKLD